MQIETVLAALSEQMPSVLRWCGAVARRLRQFNISVNGQKLSGSSNTDALTLADLTCQELLVAALRDGDPIFRRCRIEAEESTGDLQQFAANAELTIALDPIDGTKQYRDRSGNGYAVMLHLRSPETVHYSLCYIPETGAEGTWVEAAGTRIVCGPDDPSRPARDVLQSMTPITAASKPRSKKIYLIGFQDRDRDCAQAVTDAGLQGFVSDDMPGSIYDLQSRGEFVGSLIHTPNVYDFPVSLHLARIVGGEALWVHNREPVHFRETWLDDRADMLRLPGIVACADDREVLDTLCTLARDWNPVRYAD